LLVPNASHFVVEGNTLMRPSRPSSNMYAAPL
jgi:hypothetical protein